MLQHDMPFALTFLLLTGILIFVALRKHPSSLLFALLFPCVQFIDMTWFGGSQPLSSVNPAAYFSRSWRVVEPLKREAQQEFFRISIRTAGGIIMDRNQGMIDRIFTLEGYTPLALKRRQPPIQSGEKAFDLLNVKYRTVRDEGGRISFVRNPTYLPRAFMVYRTYVARNDTDLVQFLNSPEFDDRAIAAFEEDPGITIPASVTPPTSRVSVTGYSNNEITIDVETSTDGILVLSEIFYPGWTSLIDGSPNKVYGVDYCLRGVVTPAGHHTVVLRFAPTSFSRGMLLTLAALGVCVTGFVVSFRRSRIDKDREGAHA
jgi:hypothetical protein